VLDDDLAVVSEADAFLRHVRFGRDQPESTIRAYAGSIALFLRWCARTGRRRVAVVHNLHIIARQAITDGYQLAA
jgi:site-specific recombinase XerD